MELVSQYQGFNYYGTFLDAKQLWIEQNIKATPTMASLIEKHGITRHNYSIHLKQSDLTTSRGFYKNYLAMMIWLIDNQRFDDLDTMFALEENLTL